jgi:hypothetical protein
MRSSRIAVMLLCACTATAWAGELDEIGIGVRELQPNEKPAPRALTPDELQIWYGPALDLKHNAELAAKVQEAEALLTAIYMATDGGKRRGWMSEVLALNLPPMLLRAVIRHGHFPLSPETNTGMIYAETPLLGYPGERATAMVSIPSNYSHDHEWPVIISLCSDIGTLGSAPGYIVINPQPHGGAPHRGYCWGPAMVARAVPWSTLDWTMLHYRIDPDRVYLHGHGCFGGVGSKNHGTVYTDHLAAICSLWGPPLHPEYASVYRNLLNTPLLLGDATDNDKDPLHKWETDTVKKFGIPLETDVGKEYVFFAQHPRVRAPERIHFSSHEDAPAARRHSYVEIAEANSEGNTEIIYNVKSFMNYYPKDKDWQNDSKLVKSLTDKQERTQYEEQLKDAVSALGDDGHPGHPENDGSLSKEHRELLARLFSEKNIDRYKVLLKQAVDAHLILETRAAWMKPREVDLHLDRYENTVVIERTAFVKRLRIYVDDDALDLDREISVKLGNKIVFKKKLERSTEFMLNEMARTHRRDLTYWAAIDVPCH